MVSINLTLGSRQAPQSPTVLSRLTLECPVCVAEIFAEVRVSGHSDDTVVDKRLHILENNLVPLMEAKVGVEGSV